MAAWQWGNNHFTFRRHDIDGRLENWEFRNGATVLRKDFTYDTASRITGIADPLQPSQSTGYGYDALDRLLAQAVAKRPLSARACHRIAKVARTIADLAQSDSVRREHVAEALSLRRFDAHAG